jgi:integrase
VPAILQPYLLKLAQGKQPTDRLFKSWTVRWLLTNVKRCKKAGVPEICTHALRGTHSTLATEHGVAGHVVAAALGHVSVSTTYGNYTDPSAISTARNRRVLDAIGLHNETVSNVVQEDLGN